MADEPKDPLEGVHFTNYDPPTERTLGSLTLS